MSEGSSKEWVQLGRVRVEPELVELLDQYRKKLGRKHGRTKNVESFSVFVRKILWGYIKDKKGLYEFDSWKNRLG